MLHPVHSQNSINFASQYGGNGLLKVQIPQSPVAGAINGGPASSVSAGRSASVCSGGSFTWLMPPSAVNGNKEEWFSLEGPLQMKCLSGALSLLQPRRRLYFGLEELDNKLVFYRTKADFDAHKDCLGHIPMGGAFCSLLEGNLQAFMLHTESNKKYLFEADNERAADCWLNALQKRREVQQQENGLLLDGGPLLPVETQGRRRSRSPGLLSAGGELADSDSMSAVVLGGIHWDRAMGDRPPSRRRLPPLRLDMLSNSSREHGLDCHRLGTSTPPTPLSMPPAVESALFSRNKYSQMQKQPTLRKASSVMANGGLETLSELEAGRREKSAKGMGETPTAADCCLCATSGGRWMLDSWLKDQQIQQQEDQQQQNGKYTPDAGGVNGGRQQAREEAKMGLTAAERENGSMAAAEPDTFSLPPTSISALADLPPTTSAFCAGSSPPLEEEDSGELSDTTCESAGALAEQRRESRKQSKTATGDTDSELLMLRELSNRQKGKILELSTELEMLRRMVGANGEVKLPPADPVALFTAKSRFLNAELFRVVERKQEADRKAEEYKKKIANLEGEMEEFKKEYIRALQSCVRIPLRENSACDVMQVKLFGGNEHQRRVKKLVEQARESDPKLPTFESLTKKGQFHVDAYGFRHSFEGDVPLALHYIATQLHQHYQSQSADHVQLENRWSALLDAQPDFIERNRETRQLCRLGLPRSLRGRIWRLLIDQQVAELKAEYGPYYYRELCSAHGTPAEKHYSTAHQKQVNLDLLRTMPSNVHFMSASCKGVTHLQSVLRAYCLHNPSMGYCQGMNFLVATALLFMCPEDAFWFLVAVTECYFDSSYFDQSLTGAQADQEVLKEIVEQKFPRLAQHLEECEIDLTTVTLNWFIALFFDAVPFQTMLRFWDCFLMEGPKVLFRFTIGLLGHYEEEILAHSDTISVIKVLKAAVRLTLDVDGLIRFAFEELNPFPNKAYLRHRASLYLQVLQERLQKRQQLRHLLTVSSSQSPQSDQLCDLPIEVVLFSPFSEGRAYVCAGNKKRGKLSLIQLHEEAVNLHTLDLEFDCRPVSMAIFQFEMAFVSLLSGYIVAVHLRDGGGSGDAEILWELKLNDVALKLLYCSRRLYSCLANGTLAVLENAFERMPSALDLYHIPVAAAPITDALLDEEHLYLAVACKIVVLNRHTLSTVASVYVASAAAGSQVPMFEKIRTLANSPYGIWLVTAHSSLLQLWNQGQCEMLFDIRYDHSHRKPSFDEHDEQLDQVEVCAILFHADELWVGTVDGYLMLYRVHLAQLSLSPAAKCRPSLGGKYQPGKRLAPAHGLAQPVPPNRQQTYYIPTESEARTEERNSSMENMVMDGPERRAGSKISVKIDQLTRKYSVNVLALRQPSFDSEPVSANGVCSGPGRIASSCSSDPLRSSPSLSAPFLSAQQSQQRLMLQLNSRQHSVDSALCSSVFTRSRCASITDQRRPDSQPTTQGGGGSVDCDDLQLEEESSCWATGEEDEADQQEEEAEAGERDQQRQQQRDAQRRRFPSRLVRIRSWRKMSTVGLAMGSNGPSASGATAPIAIVAPNTGRKLSTEPSSAPTIVTGSSHLLEQQPAKAQGEEVRIRRKDLDFEEPLLLAMKEGESIPPSLGTSPPSRKPSWRELANGGGTEVVNVPLVGGELETTEINSPLGMALQMKLKVADKPVRCIALGHFRGQDVVVTGAGEYGDEEALLRWRRDPNSALWINDPLVDISLRTRKWTSAGLTSPGGPKTSPSAMKMSIAWARMDEEET